MAHGAVCKDVRWARKGGGRTGVQGLGIDGGSRGKMRFGGKLPGSGNFPFKQV